MLVDRRGAGLVRALRGARLIPLCEHTVIAGKYRLVRELAGGGMGAVWEARHLALEEDVAVKFMRAELPDAPAARARFAREAQVGARLRGPHVVQVLDHGEDHGMPYLVMELLDGETLSARLHREGRLELGAASAICDQIAGALMRAHRAGVVHRDLKPANVFLARLDGEEIVKVLDFGIAREAGADAWTGTADDLLLGSPQYMSPEQARGSPVVDHRSDLWSLGAILFRALTGAPAFDGASPIDVVVRVSAGPIPVPSRVAPDLPPEIDGFFLRALARDPAERFASAREMAGVFAALARRLEPVVRLAPAGHGPGATEAARTLVTQRSPLPAPPDGPLSSAPSAAEIDAFVEQAFTALLAPAPGPGAARPSDAAEAEAVHEPTVPVLRRLSVAPPRLAPREGPAQSGDRRVREAQGSFRR